MKKLKILNLKALIILKKLIVPRNIFQIKNREWLIKLINYSKCILNNIKMMRNNEKNYEKRKNIKIYIY